MEPDVAVNPVVKIDAETVDADGYVSLWNIAAATMDGDAKRARELAGKLLGFLCRQRCPFVVISSTDAKYLDEWFERDPSLLYDWSPESERVDVVAQHAHVPSDLIVKYLRAHKFEATTNYNPRRAARVEWFNSDWCVG